MSLSGIGRESFEINIGYLSMEGSLRELRVDVEARR